MKTQVSARLLTGLAPVAVALGVLVAFLAAIRRDEHEQVEDRIGDLARRGAHAL